MKKIFSSIALSLSLVLPTIALAAGSSYSISYFFETGLTGQTRSFTGGKDLVGVFYSVACRDYNCNNTFDTTDTFNVALYRDGFWSDDYIGSSKAPRSGNKTITWSSVGEGDYYIKLWKTSDGTYVKSQSGSKLYIK
ncbi:hypothetical protein ETC05_14375 [Geobacillus sp. BMUD]|uniref:hypothetical protein n=1 Tax=Geobacillus sp. BMUD TaxID=2508876 RepID=UPI0014919028|nr:hypothetical protein [Geobacillus sp. BMUD]NNU84953.1 hypothetical protein [Geobacillus sp. BMUD]